MNTSGTNAPSTVISVVLFAVALLIAIPAHPSGLFLAYVVPAILLLAAVLTRLSLLMAKQWEKAVILRFGKPVPANVDAILFWQVHDPQRAALEITDYSSAILRVAQTSLREMIGASPLSALMSERKSSDLQLKEEIGRKTAEWGVAAIAVEIRDVAIPTQLQDAMSRQAQAEREKAARVILGSAEAEVAHKFLEAANIYARNPAAMQLRAMNIVYETTKERGATILIPSAMVDCMNPGGVLGLAACAAGQGSGEQS